MALSRGVVEFEAGGETRQLRFNMNAMVRYQEASGKTFIEAVQDLQANHMDFRTLRMLFWVGLGNGTQDEAGDMIDDIGIKVASELMGQALSAAFPGDEASDDAGNVTPKKAVTKRAS